MLGTEKLQSAIKARVTTVGSTRATNRHGFHANLSDPQVHELQEA
jgi:hypothetical protein